MGYYTTAEIVKIVNKLIDRCGTRDPYKVAKELGINIIYRDFEKQRGAYKVILKNRLTLCRSSALWCDSEHLLPYCCSTTRFYCGVGVQCLHIQARHCIRW